ncbi:hypothetical protein ACFY0A_38680 [Streptomyces sp. NPDC001698]|uniref:hypothetical protein n=1 Tax=unclassified Streptomyces TaxID=2593676 RepID=UPI0036D11592
MLVRRHRADDPIARDHAKVIRLDLIIVDDRLLLVSLDAVEGFYHLLDAAYRNWAASPPRPPS